MNVVHLLDAPPRVRSDDAPPRMKHNGPLHRLVRTMARNDWTQVTRPKAKLICAAARDLGGRATMYRVSEAFWCVKVLDAPWMNGLDAAQPARAAG